MKQRGCTEDEAYRALRKMAMDRGKRLVSVAETWWRRRICWDRREWFVA